MDLIKGFFKGEYATDVALTPATDLREDLWLDFLALEELNDFLQAAAPSFKADWEQVRTLRDLIKLLPAPAEVPVRGPEALKQWFPPVLDRFKEKRQQEEAAVPLIGFYHAGGLVANMRLFAKELDAVMGGVSVNPMWVELPGRGVRAKEQLLFSCKESSREVAAVVASQVLGGDRSRKFVVFGHSVGTLHAFETTRELERLGFVPRALVVLNRQAPQIPMDRPEDDFGSQLSDEQFIAKMSGEYNQKTLAELWKTHPEMVRGGVVGCFFHLLLLTLTSGHSRESGRHGHADELSAGARLCQAQGGDFVRCERARPAVQQRGGGGGVARDDERPLCLSRGAGRPLCLFRRPKEHHALDRTGTAGEHSPHGCS